ncbi:MAG: efflux RND transporter periplasmic adaptor subunit [Gammaproteobacteria bacterium]|nr:efflux RND transporter periplasmic adaptor subunit [Gammaproteobacteria bacterium]
MLLVKITARTITVFLVMTLLTFGVVADESSAKDGSDSQIPDLDCVIEPSEIIDIGSAVPGVVESILADRNDLVVKGTMVAQLEASVERATLELSRERANLNTAIELREEGARFGHLTQNRNRSLLQTAAISKHELDTVVSETRIAELQVRQERDNKRIAGLELQRAQAVLDRLTIRSPVDGVVVDRFKSAGEYIENEPVMRVAQLDPLHVEVILSTDYLGRIKPGMQAQVTPTIPEAGTYLATVERVDRVSDAASGTYGVRLSLANPDYTIPAGLRCRLGFIPADQAANMDIAADADAAMDDLKGSEKPTLDVARPESQAVSHSPSPGTLPDPESATDNRIASVNPVQSAVADSVAGPLTVAGASEQTAIDIPSETMDKPDKKKLDSAESASGQTVTVHSDVLGVNGASEPVAASIGAETVLDAVVSKPAMKKEQEQPGSCHSIGPFARESVARQWFDGLHEVSEHLKLRDESESVDGDFIVLTTAGPDPKAIERLIGRLDKADITDRYLFRSGARKGAVSLGVYSNHRLAVKRQQDLAGKGFSSEIVPRSNKIRHYWWLDLTLPAGADLSSWIAQLPSDLSAKPVICSEKFAQR